MTGSLIAIVGAAGVGKTTFTKSLCAARGYSSSLEQHIVRPFQQLFSQDLTRYALANQVDYLLLRAEQELEIRRQTGRGVIDGGLDQDFYVFTRLFYEKGYLDDAEYALCERLYRQLRASLPPPELTVWLQAPPEVIAARFARRKRALQIAQLDDLQRIEVLLRAWLVEDPPKNLVVLDVTHSPLTYGVEISQVVEFIDKLGL